MAGLIQQAQMPQGAEPEVEDGMDESHPEFQRAMQFLMEALYEKKIALDVANALKGRDPADGIANLSYDIMTVIEDKTGGAVPDELLVLLATKVLEEVAEIAEAGGAKVKSSVIAVALKTMILRFLGEQGMDTTELQSAMDQVDPAEFDRMAEEPMQ